MMASNGLLDGISGGLKLGLEGFLGERDRRDKRAMLIDQLAEKKAERERQIAKDQLDTQEKIGGLLTKGAVVAGDATPRDFSRFKIGDTELAFNPKQEKAWVPNPLQEVQYQNAVADLKSKNEKATPVGKYNAMPSEAKGKVGNITNALTALTKAEDAFDSGIGPQYLDSSIPLIGNLISDNDFTSAQNLMNEEVGRLQSGGAIGEQEVINFKKLDPRAGDSDAIKRSKLIQKREWLENKLNAFGVKKESLADLGFDPEKMGLLRDRSGASKPKSGLLSEATASSMAEQDSLKRQERIKQLKSKVGK